MDEREDEREEERKKKHLKALNIRAKPAADVARLLDEAQVPNILWGELALTLVGRNDSWGEVEFVIPDNLTESASNALVAAGFSLCTNPDCGELRHDRWYPIADVHFHIQPKYPYHTVLSLFTKSSLLWWLPEFELRPPRADDPDLMLSNDSRLPPFCFPGCSGPWSDLYPIKILNPNSFTEAVLLLYCRDYNHANNFTYRWVTMLTFLTETQQHPTLVVKKHLRPRFHAIWESLHHDVPGVKNFLEPLRDLRDEMIKNNELPPPPLINAFGTVERAKENWKWL